MNHDLPTGIFGPYSKRYLGYASIPTPGSGTLTVFPLSVGLRNGRRVAALMDRETRDHWTHAAAASDLSFFVLRYYLSRQRNVYADAEYAVAGNGGWACRIQMVNRSAQDHTVEVATGYLHEWDRPAMAVQLPRGSAFFGAEAYEDLQAHARYATDGERACVRQLLFTSNGKGLEGGLGEWPGDSVSYQTSLASEIQNASLYIRFCKPGPRPQRWTLEWDGRPQTVCFQQSAAEYGSFSGWRYLEVPLGRVHSGIHRLRLTVAEPEAREFLGNEYKRNLYGVVCDEDANLRTYLAWDCFVVASSGLNPAAWIKPIHPVPRPVSGRMEQSLALVEDRSMSGPACWALGANPFWSGGNGDDMAWKVTEIPQHHHHRLAPAQPEIPPEDRVYTHAFHVSMPPLELPAGTSRCCYFGAAHGADPSEARTNWQALEREGLDSIVERGRARQNPECLALNDPSFGPAARHIAAYLLSTVHYPLWIKDRAVRGESPAKCTFPMLYTWDAGLTALGQIEVDEARAESNIRQYLTPTGAQEGFIQHGTALPTQIYAAWALFQKRGDPAGLRALYPLMKNATLFYAGRHPASTNLRNRNGFINTSHLWYNALGMDDYPVQVYFGKSNWLSHGEFPETNSSGIRFAKIMRTAAELLANREDVDLFTGIISELEAPLLRLWDPEAAYFHYGLQGQPVQYEDRINWNMGIAGAYPLVAGLEEHPKIRDALLDHLTTEGHLLCDYGISTVDLRAPYFDPNGYWNGRVWMAHQWMFWKALLDMGAIQPAEEIARRALKTYSRSEANDGHCFENFLVADGSGAGTPHFGALSAPVLSFYCAYYSPGRINTGFDAFVMNRQDDSEGYPLEFILRDPFRASYDAGLVLVLKPDRGYRINGTEYRTSPSGAISLRLPLDGRLAVTIRPVSA